MTTEETLQELVDGAVAAHQVGNLMKAEAVCWQILERDPRCPDGWAILAVCSIDMQRPDAAIVLLRQAMAIVPDFAQYHLLLNKTYLELRRFPEGAEAARTYLKAHPDCPDGWNALGACLANMGCPRQATTALMKATALKPDWCEPYVNISQAYAYVNDYEGAAAACQKGLAVKPDSAEARWNLSLAQLTLKQWDEGWQNYEIRHQVKTFPPLKPTSVPRWYGQPLEGKRISVWAEQGAGDMILSARWVKHLEAMGAKVSYLCDASLVELFTANGIDAYCEYEGREVDYWVPGMSIPSIVKEGWLSGEAYLQSWKTPAWILDGMAEGDGLRVGLVWAGDPKHVNDRNRSVKLADFEPLFMDGVRFFSLQVGKAGRQVAETGLPVTDLTPEIKNFADTAALIANLDLVITVDTAVANLAGAMGKETWLLLPKYNIDWRWGLDGPVCAWYESVRLFRGMDIEGVKECLRERLFIKNCPDDVAVYDSATRKFIQPDELRRGADETRLRVAE